MTEVAKLPEPLKQQRPAPNVALEGGPAPPTPEHIAAAVELSPVGERFFQEFALRQVLLNAAKNGSGSLCRWHFRPGGGPECCRACHDEGLACTRRELGADGRLCHYRGHPLISTQEHEAWDVLLACRGQLRLAPTGHVVGIDLDAALTLAAARGHDLALLSELLPAAEAGLVVALSSDRDGVDEP